MSVQVRPYVKGRTDKWEVDIRFAFPDGTLVRKRLVAPGIRSRSAAKRWGESCEQRLLQLGLLKKEVKKKPKKKIPTFAQFVLQFYEEYCQAERLRPSTLRSYEQVIRCHLLPHFGRLRLNRITTGDVQRLKGLLSDRAPKTVNNILCVLSVILGKAVDWRLIPQLPCKIQLLKLPKKEGAFHDFDAFEDLVAAAQKTDERSTLVLLLGGEAGLRMGEIIALRWPQVDLRRKMLMVSESEWRGHVTPPKSSRSRQIPMTDRLYRALQAHRHLRGERVLYRDDGETPTERTIRGWVEKVERRAKMEVTGRVHILRHTFCSHLAMKGASAKAIQELAGHSDLSTTMRYMHLSPNARGNAIALLNHRSPKAEKFLERRLEE